MDPISHVNNCVEYQSAEPPPAVSYHSTLGAYHAYRDDILASRHLRILRDLQHNRGVPPSLEAPHASHEDMGRASVGDHHLPHTIGNRQPMKPHRHGPPSLPDSERIQLQHHTFSLESRSHPSRPFLSYNLAFRSLSADHLHRFLFYSLCRSVLDLDPHSVSPQRHQAILQIASLGPIISITPQVTPRLHPYSELQEGHAGIVYPHPIVFVKHSQGAILVYRFVPFADQLQLQAPPATDGVLPAMAQHQSPCPSLDSIAQTYQSITSSPNVSFGLELMCCLNRLTNDTNDLIRVDHATGTLIRAFATEEGKVHVSFLPMEIFTAMPSLSAAAIERSITHELWESPQVLISQPNSIYLCPSSPSICDDSLQVGSSELHPLYAFAQFRSNNERVLSSWIPIASTPHHHGDHLQTSLATDSYASSYNMSSEVVFDSLQDGLLMFTRLYDMSLSHPSHGAGDLLEGMLTRKRSQQLVFQRAQTGTDRHLKPPFQLLTHKTSPVPPASTPDLLAYAIIQQVPVGRRSSPLYTPSPRRLNTYFVEISAVEQSLMTKVQMYYSPLSPVPASHAMPTIKAPKTDADSRVVSHEPIYCQNCFGYGASSAHISPASLTNPLLLQLHHTLPTGLCVCRITEYLTRFRLRFGAVIQWIDAVARYLRFPSLENHVLGSHLQSSSLARFVAPTRDSELLTSICTVDVPRDGLILTLYRTMVTHLHYVNTLCGMDPNTLPLFLRPPVEWSDDILAYFLLFTSQFTSLIDPLTAVFSYHHHVRPSYDARNEEVLEGDTSHIDGCWHHSSHVYRQIMNTTPPVTHHFTYTDSYIEQKSAREHLSVTRHMQPSQTADLFDTIDFILSTQTTHLRKAPNTEAEINAAIPHSHISQLFPDDSFLHKFVRRLCVRLPLAMDFQITSAPQLLHPSSVQQRMQLDCSLYNPSTRLYKSWLPLDLLVENSFAFVDLIAIALLHPAECPVVQMFDLKPSVAVSLPHSSVRRPHPTLFWRSMEHMARLPGTERHRNTSGMGHELGRLSANTLALSECEKHTPMPLDAQSLGDERYPCLKEHTLPPIQSRDRLSGISRPNLRTFLHTESLLWLLLFFSPIRKSQFILSGVLSPPAQTQFRLKSASASSKFQQEMPQAPPCASPAESSGSSAASVMGKDPAWHRIAIFPMPHVVFFSYPHVAILDIATSGRTCHLIILASSIFSVSGKHKSTAADATCHTSPPEKCWVLVSIDKLSGCLLQTISLPFQMLRAVANQTDHPHPDEFKFQSLSATPTHVLIKGVNSFTLSVCLSTQKMTLIHPSHEITLFPDITQSGMPLSNAQLQRTRGGNLIDSDYISSFLGQSRLLLNLRPGNAHLSSFHCSLGYAMGLYQLVPPLPAGTPDQSEEDDASIHVHIQDSSWSWATSSLNPIERGEGLASLQAVLSSPSPSPSPGLWSLDSPDDDLLARQYFQPYQVVGHSTPHSGQVLSNPTSQTTSRTAFVQDPLVSEHQTYFIQAGRPYASPDEGDPRFTYPNLLSIHYEHIAANPSIPCTPIVAQPLSRWAPPIDVSIQFDNDTLESHTTSESLNDDPHSTMRNVVRIHQHPDNTDTQSLRAGLGTSMSEDLATAPRFGSLKSEHRVADKPPAPTLALPKPQLYAEPPLPERSADLRTSCSTMPDHAAVHQPPHLSSSTSASHCDFSLERAVHMHDSELDLLPRDGNLQTNQPLLNSVVTDEDLNIASSSASSLGYGLTLHANTPDRPVPTPSRTGHVGAPTTTPSRLAIKRRIHQSPRVTKSPNEGGERALDIPHITPSSHQQHVRHPPGRPSSGKMTPSSLLTTPQHLRFYFPVRTPSHILTTTSSSALLHLDSQNRSQPIHNVSRKLQFDDDDQDDDAEFPSLSSKKIRKSRPLTKHQQLQSLIHSLLDTPHRPNVHMYALFEWFVKHPEDIMVSLGQSTAHLSQYFSDSDLSVLGVHPILQNARPSDRTHRLCFSSFPFYIYNGATGGSVVAASPSFSRVLMTRIISYFHKYVSENSFNGPVPPYQGISGTLQPSPPQDEQVMPVDLNISSPATLIYHHFDAARVPYLHINHTSILMIRPYVKHRWGPPNVSLMTNFMSIFHPVDLPRSSDGLELNRDPLSYEQQSSYFPYLLSMLGYISRMSTPADDARVFLTTSESSIHQVWKMLSPFGFNPFAKRFALPHGSEEPSQQWNTSTRHHTITFGDFYMNTPNSLTLVNQHIQLTTELMPCNEDDAIASLLRRTMIPVYPRILASMPRKQTRRTGLRQPVNGHVRHDQGHPSAYPPVLEFEWDLDVISYKTASSYSDGTRLICIHDSSQEAVQLRQALWWWNTISHTLSQAVLGAIRRMRSGDHHSLPVTAHIKHFDLLQCFAHISKRVATRIEPLESSVVDLLTVFLYESSLDKCCYFPQLLPLFTLLTFTSAREVAPPSFLGIMPSSSSLRSVFCPFTSTNRMHNPLHSLKPFSSKVSISLPVPPSTNQEVDPQHSRPGAEDHHSPGSTRLQHGQCMSLGPSIVGFRQRIMNNSANIHLIRNGSPILFSPTFLNTSLIPEDVLCNTSSCYVSESSQYIFIAYSGGSIAGLDTAIPPHVCFS